MNKKSNFILIVLLVVAGCLRLYNLGIGDLVTDEAKTALGIAYPHSLLLPSLAVASQKIFGVSEWAVRFPFAVLGMITMWLWYGIGKLLKGKNFGLVLASFAAMIPTNGILSRTAYLDAPVVLVWLIVLYYWLKLEQNTNQEKSTNNWWLWFWLAVAPWVKLQAVFVHVILGLIILVQSKGRFWRDSRAYLVALSLVPIIGYVLGQPQQLYDIYSYVTQQSNGVRTPGLWLFVSTLVYWLWPFLVLGFFGFTHLIKNNRSHIYLYIPFFGVGALALFFSLLGTRQLYYLALIDPLVIVGVGLGVFYGYEKYKIITSLAVAMAVVWSGFIIINQTSIRLNFCTGPLDFCYWQRAQTGDTWLDVFSRSTEKNYTYFLGDGLGYTPKWMLAQEAKKLDALPYWLRNHPHESAVVLTTAREAIPAESTQQKIVLADAVMKLVIISPVTFDKAQ